MKTQEKLISLIIIIAIVALAAGGYFWYSGVINNDKSDSISFSLTGPIDYARYQETGLTTGKIDNIFTRLREIEQKRAAGTVGYDEVIEYGGLQKILHEYDLALESFLKAIEEYPHFGPAYAEVAELYVYPFKRYEEAVDYYLKAIELAPYKSDYYRWLADLYVSKFPDKKSEIEPLLVSGAAANESNADEYYAYLISYFWREGEIAKAIEYANKAIAANPEKESYRQNLAELQAELKK